MMLQAQADFAERLHAVVAIALITQLMHHPLMHSSIHKFVHSFIHSFIRSFIHSFVRSCVMTCLQTWESKAKHASNDKDTALKQVSELQERLDAQGSSAQQSSQALTAIEQRTAALQRQMRVKVCQHRLLVITHWCVSTACWSSPTGLSAPLVGHHPLVCQHRLLVITHWFVSTACQPPI